MLYLQNFFLTFCNTLFQYYPIIKLFYFSLSKIELQNLPQKLLSQQDQIFISLFYSQLKRKQLQIILLKLLNCYFYFQFTTRFFMVAAWILIPIAKFAFLVQYYILLLFIIFKKIHQKIFNHPDSNSHDFSYHPIKNVHPHVFVHSHELTRHQNFSFQTYQCQTQDKAYVTLWRIKHLNSQKWNQENPILIQHGLLDCSMTWFLNQKKENSLPFILAQQGYDVWVGNNRGTIFSDRNSHLPDYWNFNIDHFVKYDQPTLINKVLQETGKYKLIYIGHSQGSTQFLMGQGQNQQLQVKIQKFIGMGTVISFQNLKDHGLLKTLSKFYLLQIMQKLGFKAILNLPKWMNRKVGVLAHHYEFYVNIILNFISYLCGKTESQRLDAKRIGILVSHQPGGTSVHSVKHWIQTFRNGKFRKYDYGKKKNIQIHGSQIPPDYTFGHIKTFPFKTHIFRGQKDAVISDIDFENMIGHFDKNNIEVHLVKDYAHLDYAWSMSAKEDVYDKIVDILKKQRPQSTFQKSVSVESTQETILSSGQSLWDFDN